jgi:septal ring factor EnvC (AmiA/AmiB activator)
MPAMAGAFETREVGVVSAERLNLRLGAGTGYPVVKVLIKDDQVRVLSHEKGWLKVLHDGDVGYVADEDRFIKRYSIHTVNDAQRTDLDAAAVQAADIQNKINEQTAEVARYTDQEKEIADQLHQTDLALHQARRAAGAISSELAVVTAQIAELEKSLRKTQDEIDQSSGYAIRRLVSLYKLTRLGEANLLASATSIHDLMARQAAIERIITYDHQVLAEMVEKKTRFQTLVADLNHRKNEKEALNAEHQAAVATLAREQSRRKALLAEIQSKKETRLASIKYLKNAAIQLDKTISSLRRKAPSAKEAMSQFSAYQGLLKMPVDGKVISAYGTYVEPQSGASNFHNGIEIQSKQGTPVRAVFAGETIFSSWLKGYGNVIIIAHGKDFHTVYAHAEELFRAKGEPVETGEVIATVGDTGSMSGPSLYFEIRHQGRPVDPLEWISKS